jgi:hypothetical protein
MIMTVRNADKYLEEALESVFAQTWKNWEANRRDIDIARVHLFCLLTGQMSRFKLRWISDRPIASRFRWRKSLPRAGEVQKRDVRKTTMTHKRTKEGDLSL